MYHRYSFGVTSMLIRSNFAPPILQPHLSLALPLSAGYAKGMEVPKLMPAYSMAATQ